GLEGLALVLEVRLGRLDQVGDEVVPALELDVDLRERVLEAVPQADQPVVDADHPEDEHDDDDARDDESDHAGERTRAAITGQTRQGPNMAGRASSIIRAPSSAVSSL